MKTTISKTGPKNMVINRNFAAPLKTVWAAWTQAELLDQWWAPEPYKAVTKSMDFREGGFWHYAMVGEGNEIFARLDYDTIKVEDYFMGKDAFCDENANVNEDFPNMLWKNSFIEEDGSTRVQVEVTFKSEEDMQKIVEMGFQEGFTAAHGNLDRLLASM